MVTFEPSASELSQEEIRAAIARELGAPLGAPGDFSLPILSIGVDAAAAWKRVGIAMVAAYTGVSYTLFGEVEASLGLNVMAMLPRTVFVLEPSLGITGL